MTSFLKMHGLGNDFVVFDARKQPVSLSAEAVRQIADRRLGVGCDQVIVIENGTGEAEAAMRIFNADGGEVESCGNAARCVSRLLIKETGRSPVRLHTVGGPLVCNEAGALISVDMGAPKLDWRDIPLSEERDTASFPLENAGGAEAAAVSMGNPHCVLFVEDAEAAPVAHLGPTIEHSSLFPERTNVEFVQMLSPSRLRVRVWERGVGVTLACGTGACAAMVTAQRRGLCGSRVDVLLDGGALMIEWAGDGRPVIMTGPAALAYRGDIDLGHPA